MVGVVLADDTLGENVAEGGGDFNACLARTEADDVLGVEAAGRLTSDAADDDWLDPFAED